jgi:hypothetical protein
VIISSVLVERGQITHERLEEVAEAPCSGLAITWGIGTTPPDKVVGPVLVVVINGDVVRVTMPLVVSAIGVGVAKLDSGVSVIALVIAGSGL